MTVSPGIPSLKLSSLFSKAALTGAIALVTLFAQAQRSKTPQDSTRRLTPHEKTFARSIFGRAVELKKVSAVLTPENTDYVAYVLDNDPTRIFFCGHKNYSSDFARDTTLENYSTFIHEVTHLWQNRNHARYDSSNHSYRYRLEAGTTFEDLGPDQQASLIEDYACHFLRREHMTPYYCDPDSAGIVNLDRIKAVVEKRLPHARRTREKLERLERRHERRAMR